MRAILLAVFLAGCSAESHTVDVAVKFQEMTERQNDLDRAIGIVERNQGPRGEVLSVGSSDEVPPRIGAYPVYFTGPSCTGDAYIAASPAAARQGFVVDADEYRMIAPGTGAEDVSALSVYDDGCRSITESVTAYLAVPNDLQVCGVPPDRIPTRVWPLAPLHNSGTVEVLTHAGCIALMLNEHLPRMRVGM